MRKITEITAKALFNRKQFTRDNTHVYSINGEFRLSIFGNDIAKYTLDNRLLISNQGYQTPTTKERLNGILMEFLGSQCLYQKKGVWYFDGLKFAPNIWHDAGKLFNIAHGTTPTAKGV